MALRQPENDVIDVLESEAQYNGPEGDLSPEMEEIRKRVEGELEE